MAEWLAQTLTCLARQDGSISSISNEKLVITKGTLVWRPRRSCGCSGSGGAARSLALGQVGAWHRSRSVSCIQLPCSQHEVRGLLTSVTGHLHGGSLFIPGQLPRVALLTFPLDAPQGWLAPGALLAASRSPGAARALPSL